MDTSFGYQPDPDDNEIFFRRANDDSSSSDFELPHRTFMSRETIAPSRCRSESDDSEPNSSKNTSPEKSSPNESSDVFDPCWENFAENSGTGTYSNVTVIEEEPILFSSHFENSSLISRPSLSSDSILDSAFIDDGDISNATTVMSGVENNLNMNDTVSQNASNDSSSEVVFLSFDQPQRVEEDTSSRNDHVLNRIENQLNYFREKFNIQSSAGEQCSKSSSCHYQEANSVKNDQPITSERETQFGDRTIAFVKEMKSATGNGKAGIPALMRTDPNSNTVKLKPMLNENESENLEKLFSTPVVMKHLRPLTLSAQRRPNPSFQTGHHNLPCVSAINKITSQISSSAKSCKTNANGVSSEPVVIKSALNFGSS